MKLTYLIRRCGQLSASLCLATLSTPGNSAETMLGPQLIIGIEANDNVRLASSSLDKDEVIGFRVDGLVRVGSKTETTEFAIVPSFAATFYQDDKEDEIRNYGFLLTHKYNGLRANSKFDATWNSRDIVNDYLPSTANVTDPIGEIGSGDTISRISVENTEKKLILREAFEYSPTQRAVMALQLFFTDVDFDNTVINDFEPFISAAAQGFFGVKTSERARLGLSVGYGYYDNQLNREKVNTQSITADYRGLLNERSEFLVSFGATSSKEDVVGARSASGFAGALGFRHRGDTSSWFIEATTRFEPNSVGSVSQRDQFNIAYENKLSQKNTLGVGLRFINDSYPDNEAARPDRQYFSLQLQGKRQVTEAISLLVRYSYFSRKTDEPNAPSSDSNVAFFGFEWRPSKLN